MKDIFNDFDGDMAMDSSSQIGPIFAEIKADVDLTSGIAADQLDNIPVLTLRNMVLFPDMTMPSTHQRRSTIETPYCCGVPDWFKSRQSSFQWFI